MKKQILLVLISVVFLNYLKAQNDSAKTTPRFQFAVGGYFGEHDFVPYTNYHFDNLSGIDRGLLVRTIFNITKKFSSSIDFRSIYYDGEINFNDGVSPEIFNIRGSGFEIPVLVTYKICNSMQKEILSISAGAGYQRTNYQTNYSTPLDPRTLVSTVGFKRYKDLSTIENYTALFAISKKFQLTRRNYLGVFYEFEIELNSFHIEDLININYVSRSNSGSNLYFNSQYNRLGLFITI